MRIWLVTPSSNDRTPRYMEKALAAIHQALSSGQFLTLCYTMHNGDLGLAIECDSELKEAALGPLIANYPRGRLQERSESTPHDADIWSMTVRLTPDLFPILRHDQFEDLITHSYADPIDAVLQALRPDRNVHLKMELRVTPAQARRCHRARQGIATLERKFFFRHRRLAKWFTAHATDEHWSWRVWFLAKLADAPAPANGGAPLNTGTSFRHESEANLRAAVEKFSGHLFSASLCITAQSNDQTAARLRLHSVASALGAFTRSKPAVFKAAMVRKGIASSNRETFLLNNEELATLWHPPTAGVKPEHMQVTGSIQLPAPALLPSEGVDGAFVLGRTAYRDDGRIVALKRDDRRRHVHVIGRTGVGKTSLLLGQLHRDVLHGEGVGVIDPHGDLADSLLKLIPRHRTNDVVVFDASDPTHAVAFNPLACDNDSHIDQVTSGAVSAFKKLNNSWGPRLENLLRNSIFVTVEQRGTLLTVLRLLTDDTYRTRLVPQIRDDVVRAFWQREFASWSKQYRVEAVAAITNKIQPFLTNTSVRAIVCQSRNSLDIRRIMDEGKILVVNLSKGKLGEDNSALLGALLVTAIQQAAMTRADIPEEQRRDFYLSIDEFQNFVTTSFETILSEARKYRLNLTVSHQYLAQLTESTAASIAGNIGTIIVFAVGSTDADWLATALANEPGQLTPQDLVNSPKFFAYVRPLIDGMPTPPFSVVTLAPPAPHDDRASAVISSSRRQFSRPLQLVHDDIALHFAQLAETRQLRMPVAHVQDC